MFKLVNETTIPLRYRIMSLVTCDEVLGQGDLAPNQIAAYNFSYQPQTNESMLFARVLTFQAEETTPLEMIDVPADTTIRFATEITTGFLS